MLAFVRHKPLLVILLGALVLRVFTAVVVQDRLDRVWGRKFVIAGDASYYWELGQKLSAGEEYAVFSPPRRVHRMPGFPALLAVSMWLFGPNALLPARILLAIVGTGACGLVYLLGKELFNEAVGLIAAGFTAVAPVMVGFSVLILSETLFAFCLLASLLTMAKLVRTEFTKEQRTRAVALSVSTGVMIAVATYVRPSWLLAAPIFSAVAVLFADNRRQAFVRGLVIVAATLVVLMPWAVRNHSVSGHWVLTTLWVGPSLYDGLNPHATGDSNMEFFENDPAIRSMTEYEVDQYYRQKSWNFVAENPGRTVVLAWLKLIRFWKPWPNAPQFADFGYRLSVFVLFVPLVGFAMWSCWIYRRDTWTWMFTLGPVLYFSAIHMVFVGSLRYRLPTEYPLYVLSAAGLCSCWSTFKNREQETENT